MKTYVLILSKKFPAKCRRAGEKTQFEPNLFIVKKHTIRSNFELWKNRIDEVNEGKAIISIRQWSGKPYRSKQEELETLTHKDGVGIQRLTFTDCNIYRPFVAGFFGEQPSTMTLANNDGLTVEDFVDWFKDYDLSQPMAIIHFTAFRYNKK